MPRGFWRRFRSGWCRRGSRGGGRRRFAVGQFDRGWTAELALPFKSFRYRQGKEQVWGFNALRTNRWKNELSLLAPVPQGRGMFSVQQASLAFFDAFVKGDEAAQRWLEAGELQKTDKAKVRCEAKKPEPEPRPSRSN